MDWNLRTCSRREHVTYKPDEPELRARLEATTPLGEAWRCLRCGTYVLGEPQKSGGHAACQASLHEVSLLEVEQAAKSSQHRPAQPGRPISRAASQRRAVRPAPRRTSAT